MREYLSASAVNASTRYLLYTLTVLLAGHCRAQDTLDTARTTPDHWVSVDLKQWAWYLNFTSQQKAAVRAMDASYAEREAQLDKGTDYADTPAQQEARRALVAQCTEEVRAALDLARFARWLNLRNGAKPVKPNAGGTYTRIGIGVF